MEVINITEGDFVLEDARFALICGRSNHLIVNSVEQCAIDALIRHGTDRANIDIFRTPNLQSLLLVTKRIAQTQNYEAAIVLGVESNAEESARIDSKASWLTSELLKVGLEHNLALIPKLISIDNLSHVSENGLLELGAIGTKAALSAIEMVSLLRQID